MPNPSPVMPAPDLTSAALAALDAAILDNAAAQARQTQARAIFDNHPAAPFGVGPWAPYVLRGLETLAGRVLAADSASEHAKYTERLAFGNYRAAIIAASEI